jgi:hypothetical protein
MRTAVDFGGVAFGLLSVASASPLKVRQDNGTMIYDFKQVVLT